MNTIKRLAAVLALLLLAPTLESMPRKAKTASASSVVYRGSIFDAVCADNFRTVIPNTLYRANTLTQEVLRYYLIRHRIKTVICLRGEHPEEKWWQNEANVCAQQQVALHSLPLGAHSYIHPDHVRGLLTIFAHAHGPLLIHCLAGVDRTGTILGLWLLEEAGASLRKARNQLSFFRYGHQGTKYPQMKSFLKLWAALSDRYEREFALREYQAIYDYLNLAAVTKLKSGNKLLKDRVGYVGQFVKNLGNGTYRPRSKPIAAPSPSAPAAPAPVAHVQL